MRPLSLILAFAFFIAGPLVHREPAAKLPGAGTFTYTGTALSTGEPQIVASVAPARAP